MGLNVVHHCAVCRESFGQDETVVEVLRESSGGWHGGVELTIPEQRYVHPHEARSATYLGWRTRDTGPLLDLERRRNPNLPL